MLACSLANCMASPFFPPSPPPPSNAHWYHLQEHSWIPKENWLSSRSHPPPAVWDFDWLDLVQVFYMSHRLCEFMFTMVLSWLANTVSLQIKFLLSFLLPLPCTLAGKRCDTDVAYRAEHSTVSYPLHINWLRVSVLIAIYCKEKMAL